MLHWRWAVLIIIFCLTNFYLEYSFFQCISIVGLFYIFLGGWKFLRLIILTGPRDLRAFIVMKRIKYYLLWMNRKGHLIIDLFKSTVEQYPNKVAFRCEKQSWTFQELDDLSNRIALILQSNGVKKGDVISLFMESRPAYVAIWLAMSKIGAIPALINFNLRQVSLAHCIKDANSNGLIYGIELTTAVEQVLPEVLQYFHNSQSDHATVVNVHKDHENNCKQTTHFLTLAANFASPVEHKVADDSNKPMITTTTTTPHVLLDNLVTANANQPCVAPTFYSRVSSRGQVNTRDPLFYIYTSGTTGLPKAAIVNHARFYTMAYAIACLFKVTSKDVVYDSLPLYHSAGGILGVGQAFLTGATVVISRKFSASRFWQEVAYYDCTVIQYIGEICRYLLATPVFPEERQHRVRLAVGNGIRSQIWVEFQKRFGVPQIGEFYGATESNANIVNTENKVGAVGFTTRLVPKLHPVALLKIDEATDEPVRDANGLCIRCNVGEPGEMIGRIEDADPTRQFDGYVNKQATHKKVVYNVFKMGDRAFRSGDLLVMDELGYFYFRDRLGDTYRWRGENVSTTEVEALIGQCLKGQHDCVVYGVEVPKCEGRAGMACIGDPYKEVDVDKLAKNIANTLPPYARPVFLRLTAQIESTGTFKLKKIDLVKSGFDPTQTVDRLFYLDAAQISYRPIDPVVFKDIAGGKVRL